MGIKLVKLACGVAVLLFLLAVQVPAKAESITYTFTGTDREAGTSFTYISPTGFLSFDTGNLIPTTASDLIYDSLDYGPITGFDFHNSGSYNIYGTTAELPVSGTSYSLNALGTQNVDVYFNANATLNIAVTAGSAVPEPSSLILLATGLLGLAGISWRKKLPA
jgi:hypothetical protein